MERALVKFLSLAVTTTLSMQSIQAQAGSVEGPYVVWINLSKERNITDDVVERFLDSGDKTCWNDSAIMFMRSKPTSITAKLAKQALIENDLNSKQKIHRILKMHFNDAPDGFDGIIVYTDAPTRAMYSMNRNSLKISMDVDIKNTAHIPAALCNVMPKIGRLS